MPEIISVVTERLAREFLDALERAEAKLLTWGVVDGGFTEEDLVESAERFVSEHLDVEGVSPAELVADLLRRHLLVDLPFDAGRLYRTRMAESVRLFARLRQMFKFGHWRTGATLVSDFRFAMRPRVYPRRDLTAAWAMEQWDVAGVLKPGRRAALSALLSRPDFRLAGFQVRATERVLRDLDGSWNRGMIVTVGTGGGKTLAFYLPALAHIAALIGPGAAWTKAVAMYPRNELLKDQFSDTYVEARRLDAALAAQGRRRLVIGAYFGPTPWRAEVDEVREKGWQETPFGYVCPFLRCPACGGDLMWRTEHLTRRHEQLDCVNCSAMVSGEDVHLTRQRMQQSPPDVLFTTTEMLNRVMGDAAVRHVFGVGVPTPPHIILLDEVHTYVGTHGAQVALLLRRWRHAAGGRVQFTGLSATLRNAAEFFAQLTGLPVYAVEEITPTQGELEREGMEYMLVLRGDPVSKTSLLSTTIQTAMLLRRVLDARGEGAAAGADGMYGRKVFAFTDDLDVTNRLYHNLLDAEGVDQRNLPRPGRAPLASLRARGLPDNPRRLRAGQSWYLCEEIGHPEGLAVPLVIGRTSSQDTGVNRQADVIVATASLEVGYNDREVGAVLQHKAPRDAASFVQRKGRAGRLRHMRPWTVVVLSDYGRDRIAYQGYESLFDPILPPRVLPIANRYVLRMQAVFAFMDWLAQQLVGAPNGSVYRDLSGPSTWAAAATRQRTEAGIVRRLLTGDPPLEASLERYLAHALGISAEEVMALLWEPPRSLMLQALPTLLRRLESGWRRVALRPGESTRDYVVENTPLPDFVPTSLFSELNLPEVAVVSSVWPDGRSPRVDSLPIDQALRTLVPGKVTRRFAVRRSAVSHWIPLPSLDLAATHQQVAVEDVCAEYEEVGHFQVLIDGTPMEVRCVRPWAMRPSIVPPQVNTTSNAWPDWGSQLVPDGLGAVLDLPSGSPWSAHVQEVRLHAHAYGSSVEVRRFAFGARASVRLRRAHSPELQAEVRYVERESRQPAAIGSTAHVDGLRFLVSVPAQDIVRPDDVNFAKVRAFRTAYFRHRVLTDPQLAAYANVFQREWLYQVYLSVLTAWTIADSPSLRQANEAMLPFLPAAADKVLRVIFETLGADDGEEEGEGEAGDHRQRRLKEDVLTLLGQPEVARRLSELAEVLWAPPDAEWQAWAAQRYLATLGSAVLEACRQLYPEADADELVLDIDPGARPPGLPPVPPGMAELWITETTIGGGGVVEEVGRRYVEDPRRFFRLLENALGPSDREVSDAELTRVLALAETDREVADALEGVRHAPRHDELQKSVERLEAVLETRGVLVNRAVMSAVHARITRPGSSRATDELLLGLVRRWHAYEDRLGIEVDARVFAYLESDREEVARALAWVDPEAAQDRAFRFHALYALLWPRGNLIRSLALATYNPFATLPEADRDLVLDRMAHPTPAVPVGDPEWRTRVTEALRAHGSALLTAAPEERDALRAALLALAVEPLEIDFLHVFPRIDGVSRGPDGFSVALTLSETVQ
jgi:hypothetical protein